MNNSERARSLWGGCVTATPSPVQKLVWTEKWARALQRPPVPAPHQDQLGSPRPSSLWERPQGRGTARAPAGGFSIPAASLSDCVIEGRMFSLSKPHPLNVQTAIIDPHHRVLDEDLNERRNIKRSKQ